jgi:hypothetical protein
MCESDNNFLRDLYSTRRYGNKELVIASDIGGDYVDGSVLSGHLLHKPLK